jgi:hypothetical protein
MATYQRIQQRKQCDEKKVGRWAGTMAVRTIGEYAGGNSREAIAMVWVWRPWGPYGHGHRHTCIWQTFTCAWRHMSA